MPGTLTMGSKVKPEPLELPFGLVCIKGWCSLLFFFFLFYLSDTVLHQHQNRTFHDGDCNPRFGDMFWEHWLRPVETGESSSNIQMLCGNLCHMMTGHCGILSWWDCKWKRAILGICLKRHHVNSKRNSAELLGYSSFPLVNSADRSPQKCRHSEEMLHLPVEEMGAAAGGPNGTAHFFWCFLWLQMTRSTRTESTNMQVISLRNIF